MIKEDAFTFIEVMLSLLIVSVGLVTVTQAFTTILQSLDTSRNDVKAIFLLEQKIEELEMKHVDEEELSPGTLSGTFEGEEYFYWTSDINEMKDEENLNTWEVQVEWKKGRRAGRVSLNTYLISHHEELQAIP